MPTRREVTVGSFGHKIKIKLTDVDDLNDYDILKIEMRNPDGTTVTAKDASIDPEDTGNQTLLYTTVSGDFADEGEYRAVGYVQAGDPTPTAEHWGRPALIIFAASKWS